MGIVDDDIARVRESIDFVAVVSDQVALRRVGRRHVGLCPFHAEKSPSFSVNAEEGLYYCFGCGAKGDAITFVRETQHLDFVGAVEHLAGRAGITLRYDDGEKASGERKRRQRLIAVNEAAVEHYHQLLLTSPDAGAARGYLRTRGYDGEVVRRYKLGWAPDAWDVLCKALKAPPTKASEADLTDAGLGFKNRSGRMTDVFRGRIMFPILDVAGKPVAFGARKMPDGEGPKYKNTSETSLYRKSKTLYALSWAKADIVTAGEVVLCEGYTDVIGLAAAGIPNAVATCGTALTDEHLRVLQGFAKRLVLCFDADAAGQAAAERIYAWERDHEVDIVVADLPPGADPGDLARDDPAALRKAVEGARPFLEFRLDRVLGAGDLSTPEGRARVAEHAVEVIREHPSDLVRDQYVMTVADRCRVEPDRLRSILAGPARRRVEERNERGRPVPNTDDHGRPTGPARSPVEGPEAEALRIAVADPAAASELLAECLFTDDRAAAAIAALEAAPTVREAIEAADPATADLLQQVAVTEPVTTLEDVAARLADMAAGRAIRDLESRARTEGLRAYAPIIGWLKSAQEACRADGDRSDAVVQLVAWLRQHATDTGTG